MDKETLARFLAGGVALVIFFLLGGWRRNRREMKEKRNPLIAHTMMRFKIDRDKAALAINNGSFEDGAGNKFSLKWSDGENPELARWKQVTIVVPRKSV